MIRFCTCRLMVADRQRGKLLPAPGQLVGSRGWYRQQALSSQASSSEASSSLISVGSLAQGPGDMLASLDEARLDAEEVTALLPSNFLHASSPPPSCHSSLRTDMQTADRVPASGDSGSLISVGGLAQGPGDMLAALDEVRLDAEEVYLSSTRTHHTHRHTHPHTHAHARACSGCWRGKSQLQNAVASGSLKTAVDRVLKVCWLLWMRPG